MSVDEVRRKLGLSARAALNLLSRLARDGLVGRVRRGRYPLHPLGELGVTAVASRRLAEAALLAVGDRDHRDLFPSGIAPARAAHAVGPSRRFKSPLRGGSLCVR